MNWKKYLFLTCHILLEPLVEGWYQTLQAQYRICFINFFNKECSDENKSSFQLQANIDLRDLIRLQIFRMGARDNIVKLFHD
jgi:hypothetical protein